MLKLALQISLTLCLASSSIAGQKSYSSLSKSTKFIESLKPIKIYSSLHQPSKQKQMLNDLTGKGGIMLFLNKNSALYAIEGSNNLSNYLTTLLKKDYLNYLANLKTVSKSKFPLKSHYQELLKLGWKDYELCLLEAWKSQEEINIPELLAYYHTKYQPKLNLFRYVALADGKIEKVYQQNKFRTEEQRLATSQKKAIIKPLANYRIDDKTKGKVYYENKHKSGIYRVVNRDTKQSYISSSLNLGQILYALYSNTIADNQQVLYSAMQEYGLTNFNLQILAYCSIQELAEKEAYYLELYQPEYNIPKKNKEDQLIIESSLTKSLTSIIEYNALDRQLILFQLPRQSLMIRSSSPRLFLILWEVKPVHLLIREDLSPITKTKKVWTLSEATKLKQSLARRQREEQPKPGSPIKVYDSLEDKTTVYSSYQKAAQALDIRIQVIFNYLSRNQSKPYKGRYTFAKV